MRDPSWWLILLPPAFAFLCLLVAILVIRFRRMQRRQVQSLVKQGLSLDAAREQLAQQQLASRGELRREGKRMCLMGVVGLTVVAALTWLCWDQADDWGVLVLPGGVGVCLFVVMFALGGVQALLGIDLMSLVFNSGDGEHAPHRTERGGNSQEPVRINGCSICGSTVNVEREGLCSGCRRRARG